MSALSAIDRRHHSGLHPIDTCSDSPYAPRRQSRQGSIASAKSTTPLPSPSIVAARAYHLESGTSIDAQPRRRSLVEAQELPRRHSLSPTTKKLVVQLESFKFSGKGLPPVPEAEEPAVKVKGEEPSNVSTKDGDDSTELASPRQSANMLCGTPQEVLRQVPFQYTHSHLRDWGYAYLGNSATADAFVNAVSLRRSSMAAELGTNTERRSDKQLATIRARVIPQGKDRKPFLIQRQFDIEELRGSISKIPSLPGGSENERVLRRSPRNRCSSTYATAITLHKESNSTKRRYRSPSPGKGPLPIHIEYALHYLPVLGALMLSGHVRKGDSIDLPIPHPEAWRNVLTYIYTGRGSHESLTTAMKENILFLAGHA
ncbi:hypothetical protein IFR04_015506 [Cadophora malorum]|uniref:BTB domain-containing protein n=1 Tax=Cadophora malorum TaxID=108018 RepID=A0A8H7SYU3_9HELO|nr:hypothetical protein IFR04_015506 [Cadophora malorum]